jgi:hypothetical protein
LTNESNHRTVTDFKGDIVSSLTPVKLITHGVNSDDIKFGINVENFDNMVNPYFVYRAYTID